MNPALPWSLRAHSGSLARCARSARVIGKPLN